MSTDISETVTMTHQASYIMGRLLSIKHDACRKFTLIA